MTKATTQKITVTFAESQIDILVMNVDKKYYATCSYPVQRTVKTQGNPYAPGTGLLPARTPYAATSEAALKDMLDLLEKKLGQRPVVNGKKVEEKAKKG
jgi:hypothetical protein